MKSPVDLVKGAIDIIKDSHKLILWIIAVPIFFGIIDALLDPTRQIGPVNETRMMFSATFSVLLFVFINTVVIITLVLAFGGSTLSVREAYRRSLSFLPRFLALAIILFVAVTIIQLPFHFPDLILFIWVIFAIPAIALLVWMIFAELILILENVGPVEASKRGLKLIMNSWWPLFGRLLFLFLVAWVLLVLAGIFLQAIGVSLWARDILSAAFLLFTRVFMIAYLYLMYRDLKGKTMIPAL